MKEETTPTAWLQVDYSTVKIREFIHRINNLCHQKEIILSDDDLDLLGTAAISLSFIEQQISAGIIKLKS